MIVRRVPYIDIVESRGGLEFWIPSRLRDRNDVYAPIASVEVWMEYALEVTYKCKEAYCDEDFDW